MKHLQKLFFIIGTILIITAAGIYVALGYFNSKQRAIPIVFSNNAVLLETWNASKNNTIDPISGRTFDISQDNITTSEAQSYTMLRAVWMDDKPTFDRSWKFTQTNLQRPDSLFSWRYGKLPNGSYGILKAQGGYNTASDADQDIAMSLLMAYSRWDDNSYATAAMPIIRNIWQQEVIMINGQPVLAANDLEKAANTNVVVNPSYFAFANYKLFAQVDPGHDWNALAANSYRLLDEASTSSLDKTSSDGLPPNWFVINRQTGVMSASQNPEQDTNFGYDAMRIPFRLALDYSWYKDGRALNSLSRYGFLKQFWLNTHLLNTIYSHDGGVVASYESPAIYGATIGYFNVIAPAIAKDIYRTKLQTLYSPDQQSWKAPAPGYYEDNWAWFGIALTLKALPNLTVEQRP